MRRRFVYDRATDTVVEVGPFREAVPPSRRYEDATASYHDQISRHASPRSGEQLREATLERADRREYAHRRYGDEGRWKDT